MREILFRGKCEENKKYGVEKSKWVYGDLVHCDDEYTPSISVDENGWYGNYRVDPSTVGQFTGLLDRNGTRIFDGDIVSDYDEDEGRAMTVGCPVVYHDAGFYIEFPTLFHALEHGDCEYLVVIGNVYDTPELLADSD